MGAGAGISISLGRHPAVTTASGATPDGEAVACVVVVGLGFRVIEDSAGGRQRAVLGEEFMEDPLAAGTGADGEDAETSRGRGH
jgi:hypothetical protein